MNDEIKWNIVNSLLAGGLVLFGSLADGQISLTGVIMSFCASCVVALTLFKDYWQTQEPTGSVAKSKKSKKVNNRKMFTFFI